MRDKLIHMANQIAIYFRTQPEAEARTGVAQHILMFWTPRMRRQLVELIDNGEEHVEPLVKSAVERLREAPVPVETKTPG